MSLNQWGRYQGLIGGRKWVSSISLFGHGATTNQGSSTISVAWPLANLAIYIPMMVENETLIAQLYCLNGSAVSGNVDVGIYTNDGTRITSAGSTVQTGTTALQGFNVTDVTLGPGLYYVAMALDNTTGTTATASISAANGKVLGLAEQTTAFPLPAIATFATFTRTAVPWCGAVGDAVL